VIFFCSSNFAKLAEVNIQQDMGVQFVYQAMVWDQCSQCPIDSKKSHDYCDTFGVSVPWATCLRIMKALSVHTLGFWPIEVIYFVIFRVRYFKGESLNC
jgi:hypothetical protein